MVAVLQHFRYGFLAQVSFRHSHHHHHQISPQTDTHVPDWVVGGGWLICFACLRITVWVYNVVSSKASGFIPKTAWFIEDKF